MQAGINPMPLSICEPFAWYLVVKCKQCGTRQPIHRELSNGKASLLRNYNHRCAQCGNVDLYQPREIERYQHIAPPTNKPRANP